MVILTIETLFKHFEAMTLNYEEIENGYKALSDFYLILTYHTDDLPVNQLLALPPIAEIAKLPKV